MTTPYQRLSLYLGLSPFERTNTWKETMYRLLLRGHYFGRSSCEQWRQNGSLCVHTRLTTFVLLVGIYYTYMYTVHIHGWTLRSLSTVMTVWLFQPWQGIRVNDFREGLPRWVFLCTPVEGPWDVIQRDSPTATSLKIGVKNSCFLSLRDCFPWSINHTCRKA